MAIEVIATKPERHGKTPHTSLMWLFYTLEQMRREEATSQ